MLTGPRACVVVAVVVCLVTLRASASPATIDAALDLYSRGDFSAGVSAVNVDEWSVGTFTAALDHWLDRSEPAARPRRQLIAAAFALETVWVATRDSAFGFSLQVLFAHDGSLTSPPPKTLLSDARSAYAVAAWACLQMPASGPVTPAERWWWLASVGVLSDGYSWRGLLGSSPTEVTPKNPNRIDKREYDEGHLAHARARIPGEPRLQLSDALARASQTRGARPVYHFPGRPDLLNTTPLNGGEGERAERYFEAIAAESSIAGEVRVRVGYIEVLRRQWASALAHFDRARPLITEPLLLAVADYLSGWAFEQLKRPADAEAAYRRAHAIAPHVRNVSTRLAALLFLSNRRAEAYTLLDDIAKTVPPAYDLVSLLSRGDARLVPEYLSKMREALR